MSLEDIWYYYFNILNEINDETQIDQIILNIKHSMDLTNPTKKYLSLNSMVNVLLYLININKNPLINHTDLLKNILNIFKFSKDDKNKVFLLKNIPDDIYNIIGKYYFDDRLSIREDLHLKVVIDEGKGINFKDLIKNSNAIDLIKSNLNNDLKYNGNLNNENLPSNGSGYYINLDDCKYYPDFWLYLAQNKNPKALDLILENWDFIIDLLNLQIVDDNFTNTDNIVFLFSFIENQNDKAMDIIKTYWNYLVKNNVNLNYLAKNPNDKAIDLILDNLDDFWSDDDFWDELATNTNIRVFEIIKNNLHNIEPQGVFWNILASNPSDGAFDLILENLENLVEDEEQQFWVHLAQNSNDRAIDLIVTNLDNIPITNEFWNNLTTNTNNRAIDLIVEYNDFTDNIWYKLATNTNDKALDLLGKNTDLNNIEYIWDVISKNTNDKAIDLIIKNFDIIPKNIIFWKNLSRNTNPKVIALLIDNYNDDINSYITSNPNIFNIDEKDIKNKISQLKNIIKQINTEHSI
jgi:hypothetical protein